jgi:hypothetical protein
MEEELRQDLVPSELRPRVKAQIAQDRTAVAQKEGELRECLRDPSQFPGIHIGMEGMEVTQAIQDMEHLITLVASKTTVVRVYLSPPAATNPVVRGELALRRTDGEPPVIIPSLNTVDLGAQIGQLDAKRRDVEFSLNFLLPVDQTTAGPLHFNLATLTNTVTGTPIDVSLNNLNAARTVTFTTSPPLQIRILGIRYRCSGTPPVTHTPSQFDFDMVNSWLRRAFPVAEVISSQVIVDARDTTQPFDCSDPDDRPPFESSDINAQIAAIRALDMSEGATDSRTHYYSLVSDGGFFMRGSSADASRPDPSAVGSGPTGSPIPRFSWDTDGSYGDWYAGHELGHSFGREHPGFCDDQEQDDPNYPFASGQLANADDAFVGFDVGDPALNLPMVALPGVDWHDVMTYCDKVWLSSYTYEGIRTRLVAEDDIFAPDLTPLGPGTGAGQPDERFSERSAMGETAADRNLISVVGTVNLTKEEGKIAYVNPLPQGEASPTEPDSPVRCRIKGADGQVLHEYPVSVKPLSDTPGSDRLGLMDVVFAVDPDAREVELLVGGGTVDTFQASATPPRVRGLTREDAGPHALSMAWETDAEAGDEHTYAVQVSTDNGRTWQTLAVGLATPELTIDRNQFPGAEQVQIRVVATDGFTRSIVTSEPYQLEGG